MSKHHVTETWTWQILELTAVKLESCQFRFQGISCNENKATYLKYLLFL